MSHVLVTNDDGFDAEGIGSLASALSRAGHRVTVVAPDSNRSAAGHRIMIRGNLELIEREKRDGIRVLSYSGTPADCTRVALLAGVVERPDVVASGVNHGVNLGDDVRYSGTVSAAVEASLLGLPGVAISQQGPGAGVRFLADPPEQFDHLDGVVRLIERFAALARPREILNVNIPHANPDAGAMWAPLGTRRWADVRMSVQGDLPMTVRAWESDPEPVFEPRSDFSVVRDGGIAVSLLSSHGGLRDISDQATDIILSQELNRLFSGE
ncbi:5'/3'-nucleotidase SurE [Microbacterium sp. NPDC055357]